MVDELRSVVVGWGGSPPSLVQTAVSVLVLGLVAIGLELVGVPRGIVLVLGVLFIAPVAVAVYAVSSRSVPPAATNAVPKSKAAGQGGR